MHHFRVNTKCMTLPKNAWEGLFLKSRNDALYDESRIIKLSLVVHIKIFHIIPVMASIALKFFSLCGSKELMSLSLPNRCLYQYILSDGLCLVCLPLISEGDAFIVQNPQIVRVLHTNPTYQPLRFLVVGGTCGITMF